MPNFQMKPRADAQKPPEQQLWNFDLQQGPGKILAFSGKLGAGKDVCCRFLYSLAFMHVLNITPNAQVNEETGKLWIETDEGFNEINEDSRHPEVVDFLQQRVWPFMRKFSTADPMKEFLHNMFGVPSESLWGTQEEKLQPIEHLLWENMPGDPNQTLSFAGNKKLKDMSGPICGRHLMEYFGTEVIRKLYARAHAKALVKHIQNWNAAYSLVNDIRFFDEVEEIQQAGGKVIRLTRCTTEAKKNKHRSNVELDNFDGFDAIIQNDKMTLQGTFAELIRILTDWEYFKVLD